MSRRGGTYSLNILALNEGINRLFDVTNLGAKSSRQLFNRGSDESLGDINQLVSVDSFSS